MFLLNIVSHLLLSVSHSLSCHNLPLIHILSHSSDSEQWKYNAITNHSFIQSSHVVILIENGNRVLDVIVNVN